MMYALVMGAEVSFSEQSDHFKRTIGQPDDQLRRIDPPEHRSVMGVIACVREPATAPRQRLDAPALPDSRHIPS